MTDCGNTQSMWGNGAAPKQRTVSEAQLEAARDIARKLPCTTTKCQNATTAIDISRRVICDRCSLLAYLNNFLA